MSRSILISEQNESEKSEGGVGFAYNTLVFEVITEGMRAEIGDSDRECMKLCFEDLDDFGMDYICLYEIDSKCFNIFRKVCEAGLESIKKTRDVKNDYKASSEEVDAFIENWEELTAALRRDPRYVDM